MHTDDENRGASINQYVLNSILAATALLAITWSVFIQTEGMSAVDPLWGYYQNGVIRSVYWLAFVADVAIVTAASLWFLATRSPGRPMGRRLNSVLTTLGFLAAALPWVELWYGTIMTYEGRDKQGLPLTVNHAGPVGSAALLVCLLWRLELPTCKRKIRLLVKAFGATAIVLLHVALSHLASP